jgi:hypothetical protein
MLQRQRAIAALIAAGALAFVLVATWARDRYAAPSAEPGLDLDTALTAVLAATQFRRFDTHDGFIGIASAGFWCIWGLCGRIFDLLCFTPLFYASAIAHSAFRGTTAGRGCTRTCKNVFWKVLANSIACIADEHIQLRPGVELLTCA